MNRRFGAVILAAGFSSRMGTFKPLLKLGDITVIENILKVLGSTGIENTVVVTGHNRELLLPVIKKYKAREAYNSRFEHGMFTSIQTGAMALGGGFDGFFIMPVDCPLVSQQIIDGMMSAFDPGKFAVACYRGKKGHPLLVPEKFRQEIIGYGGKGGLKAITDRDPNLMDRIETGFEGVVMDMDTPEAYEELKAYMESGCRSDDLQQLTDGRRFILVRHGQIQQHKEKIFLGQTDVPLSEIGKHQAEQTAVELQNLDVRTDRVYSSDLKRASQTAEMICSRNRLDIVLEKEFREMALGPWDGKFISEIRGSMPDEYEKRGKNLMTYKMGHGSENFYDLQYRVIKKLIDILKKDNHKDIIIVAHSGVIRVIENNLQGGAVEDEWKKSNNGEIRIINLIS